VRKGAGMSPYGFYPSTVGTKLDPVVYAVNPINGANFLGRGADAGRDDHQSLMVGHAFIFTIEGFIGCNYTQYFFTG
jgi:hypothetical protein